jgi:uncharacterized membrane protein
MGIKFRKSFKAGPVKVNLSKSGIGASVGIKGARIGVDAKGNTYAAGGKGGIYFRENLGNKNDVENSQKNTETGEKKPVAGQKTYIFSGVILVITGFILVMAGLNMIVNENANPVRWFIWGAVALIGGVWIIIAKTKPLS